MYLTCEAETNFPVPNSARLAAIVRSLSQNGTRPVSVREIASAAGASNFVGAVEATLRRAARVGLVGYVRDRGWIATGQPSNSHLASGDSVF